MLKCNGSMEIVVLDFETEKPTVELALADLEIELERQRKFGGAVIKVVHGYGSKGYGGSIFSAVRKFCFKMKKQGKIKDFLTGEEWDLASSKTKSVIYGLKFFSGDIDLGKRNPGITIILI